MTRGCLRNSPLGLQLAHDDYRARNLPDQAFIIGDSAFQLSTYLITPFRENQLRAERAGEPTPEQKRQYNKVLSGAQVVVEHTFGMLKSRFRRLFLIETKSVENVIRIVSAACVLHNICSMHDDEFDEVGAGNVVAGNVDDVGNNDDAPAGDDSGGVAATHKRFRLVEEMWAER